MNAASLAVAPSRKAARYDLPVAMRDALAAVFGTSREIVDRVRIVEHSRFARLHGRTVLATTRRDAIYLAGSGAAFARDPDLVLHEYFHVLRQWNPGGLSAWRYLAESLRRGYRSNRFEVDACAFACAHLVRFRDLQ